MEIQKSFSFVNKIQQKNTKSTEFMLTKFNHHNKLDYIISWNKFHQTSASECCPDNKKKIH